MSIEQKSIFNIITSTSDLRCASHHRYCIDEFLTKQDVQPLLQGFEKKDYHMAHLCRIFREEIGAFYYRKL